MKKFLQITAFLSVFYPLVASACMCTQEVKDTFLETENNDAVFLGKVTRIYYQDNKEMTEFKIIRNWKAPKNIRDITIISDENDWSCDTFFDVGDAYVVFAKSEEKAKQIMANREQVTLHGREPVRTHAPMLHASSCGLTTITTNPKVEKMLEELGSIAPQQY